MAQLRGSFRSGDEGPGQLHRMTSSAPTRSDGILGTHRATAAPKQELMATTARSRRMPVTAYPR